MTYSAVSDFFLSHLWPILAWVALIILLLKWLFQRWELYLTANRSLQLKFPVSPFALLDRKVIIESLVNSSEIRSAITEAASNHDEDANTIDRRVRHYAEEIVPAFSATFYFAIGYWLARTLLRTLYQVKMLRDAKQEYDEIGPNATVVMLMNHRSNIDVLLVNYLLSRRSAVSHAAGEWARLWPLYHLVKLAGNYVVDRDANDPLYRLVLRRYVQMSVSFGIHLGVFPEGSLSRDGSLQNLYFGLLNYVATASWPGQDRDIVFIPVSFNYDSIPEQERLVFEDQREFKHRGKWYVAWTSLTFCMKTLWLLVTPRENRYGWACASFGKPLSLDNWQRVRGIRLKELPGEQRRVLVEELGRELMDSAMDMMPVLPVHILALALRSKPQSSWSEAQLLEQAESVRTMLDTANAPLFFYNKTETDAYGMALSRLIDLNVVRRESDGSLTCVADRKAMLEYYANSIAHYLQPRPLDESGRVQLLESSPLNGEQKQLTIMAESYDRVLAEKRGGKAFFDEFYKRFLNASPRIAEKFSSADMVKQQAHLQLSVGHMVDFFATGKPSERMRQIAASHSKSGRDIAPELYDIWLEKLLETVQIFDESYSPSIERSWRTVMQAGMDYMRSQYRVAAIASSGTTAQQNSHSVAEDISRWIEQWAMRTPEKRAICDKQRTYTYRELAQQISRLAGGLRHGLDVSTGDRVAYLAPNRVEFLVLLFACAKLGAILVPINFRLATQEQATLIERADVKALFLTSEFAAVAGHCCSTFAKVVMDDCGSEKADIDYQRLVDEHVPLQRHKGHLQAALLIVFTSGSTGEPKGAVLTQAAVHWNALNSRLMHDMSRTDHIATTLPFFHVGGINIQTLPALQVGATVTVFAKFEPVEFMKYLEHERPSLTVLVPSQMQQLMAQANWSTADMSSIKAVATGSAIVNMDLIRAWANKGVPVIQIYGCTESAPIAIHQTVDGIGPGFGTVGHPALYTDAKVLDTAGNSVATGVEGEIALKGPSLMSHYWRDDQATEDAFRDGWLLTGDLGYQDQNGRLCIVGRKKQLIISGGENIHPGEIERVLELHADVLEAAVVGVEDAHWGEVPAALIVTTIGRPIAERDIQQHLRQHLGRFKHPRQIVQIASLPRTALGKIAYPEVAEIIKASMPENVV